MVARRIVVGYDGSESSRLALTWALGAAQERSLPVLIAYVLYEPPEVVAALGELEEQPHDLLMASRQRTLLEAEHTSRLEMPGVEVESTIVKGSRVRALLELLADAEMCVVGGRPLGPLAKLLGGSTSLQVAIHAPCPVVVVRSTDYVEPGAEEGRVILGVDGAGMGVEAVGFAFEEASLRGTGVTAVHAWEWPFHEVPILAGADAVQEFFDALEQSEGRVLAETVAGWHEKYPDVDIRQKVVRGVPAQALIDASSGAALVVVGSRGRGAFRSLLLGSVSQSMLLHANCPVAVVRAGDD